MRDPGYTIEDYLDDVEAFDGDGEPWERCGCAACQATMDVLYGGAPDSAHLPEEGDHA